MGRFRITRPRAAAIAMCAVLVAARAATQEPPTESALDPRAEILQSRLEGRPADALERVLEIRRNDPARGHAWGLDYLEGDLLQSAGRLRESVEAFERAVLHTPALAPWARVRIASVGEAGGTPTERAALLATVLAKPPEEGLGRRAAEALLDLTRTTPTACAGIDLEERWAVAGQGRRIARLARLGCLASDVDPTSRTRLLEELFELIEDDPGDAVARGAADLLEPLPADPDRRARALGRVAFEQRRYDLALEHLAKVAANPGEEPDLGYARARAHFWRGEYAEAIPIFAALATADTTDRDRAQAAFQAARSHEMLRDTARARDGYARVLEIDPDGGWAGAAHFAILRLDLVAGDEDVSWRLDRLASRGAWSDVSARAQLFVAASDIVRGRPSGVAAHLDRAERSGAQTAELFYWRGRLAELEGAPEQAASRYRIALRDDPFGLFAIEAARRTKALQFTDEAPEAAEASPLAPEAVAFARLQPRPIARWPLWSARHREAEDLLVALGLWSEAPGRIGRHFPTAEEDLVLAAADTWMRLGDARRAIRTADVVRLRLPDSLPETAWPLDLRRLLHPYPYRSLFETAAGDQSIDPLLLASIAREESRFDPGAVSPVGARGLTQFVLPTARRLAAEIGLPPPEAADLHRPSVAITLGAAYVRELWKRFDGRPDLVLAAYNAGEDQTELWISHCFSDEPAEFWTKVSFTETRHYLRRVLRSRVVYADLYGG